MNQAKFKSWFAVNRHRLHQNGVWLQGQEPNTLLYGPDYQLRVLIARLSQYHDVAASITHSWLYQLAAAVDGCYPDMAFLPPDRDEKLMRQAGVPLWLATSSHLPPDQFDVIAISNSVVQELVNLPAMLKYSFIPLSRQEREARKFPIVLLGGSNSLVHSILHGEVDEAGMSGLVDAVVVGDGERVFAQILELIRDNKELPRLELLRLLQAKISGVYLPQSYTQKFDQDGLLHQIDHEPCAPFPLKANRHSCRPGTESFIGGPLFFAESGASHVVISAGCPSFCSFCKESWEQKPYRERSADDVVADALKIKARTGACEIALMSFNANTCSDIFAIIERLNPYFKKVAIKSQRFDAVVMSPELLDLQFDSGKRTYTCAMEGISERMRFLLQKNLNESTILNGITSLFQRGLRQMKVFMILTGYENEADLTEFTAFLGKVKEIQGPAKARITFSFACLFRPPYTPMQFAGPRADCNEMRQKLKEICNLIRKSGFESRISAGPEDAWVSEFIAWADRRHTKILVDLSVNKDFRYRGIVSAELYKYWSHKLDVSGLKLLNNSEKSSDTFFPWSDISSGISQSFLWKNWQLISAEGEIRSCLAAPWGSASCVGCGACADKEERSALNLMGPKVRHLKKPSPKELSQWLVEFIIPECWAFCSRDFISAALARRIMQNQPELVEYLIDVNAVSPEFYSWGRAVAVAVIRVGHPPLNFVGRCESDIQIDAISLNKSKQLVSAFPLDMQIKISQDAQHRAREIDALLTKYKLKHHKQRFGNSINWQLNSGQAKKSGIERLSLDETAAVLNVSLISAPELFMLNRLAGTNPIKIIPGN